MPTNERFRAPLYIIVSLLAVVPVYLGAAVALLRRRVGWGGGDLVFLAAAPAYFTLLHMIFVGSTRYRAPVMPFIVIIATMGAMSFLAGPGPRAKR